MKQLSEIVILPPPNSGHSDFSVGKTKKKYLEDVVLLRLSLIFLLIWNHAFAPYSGHWAELPMQEDIPLYKWLVGIVYYMRIHALIFISGYLLGYTVNRKPEALKFKNCVVKKLKRLILPSIIFSVLYYVMFYDTSLPISKIAYSIVNGCGHLWFLPMLFWCFTGIYIIERFNLHSKILLGIILLAAILGDDILPLRIGLACKYFIYFYLGYALQHGLLQWLKPNGSKKRVAVCWSCYILGVILLMNSDYINSIINSESINYANAFNLAYKVLTVKLLPLGLSLLGLFGCYWTIHTYIIGKVRVSDTLITLSTYCYGIYICQQFILKQLYYNTSITQYFNSWVIPFVGICITLIGSIIITHIMLKTKVGRYLIG